MLASRMLARRGAAFGRAPAPVQRQSGRRASVSVRAEAPTAAAGDYVSVHYTGTLDDGSVFDTSRAPSRQPIDFQIGAGKMIRGFDKAVTGLAVGGTRKVRLEPSEAYGERDEAAVITVPADRAPKGLSVGDRVSLSNGMSAVVKEIGGEGVTIDLNPELAGKHLTFDVELVSLTPAAKAKTVVFGSGCFWGPQLRFERVVGVLSTEVGYSQGTVPEPTYEQVCGGATGHTEVVKVVYDEDALPFESLLEEFWANHDPTSKDRQGADSGTQYRAGIYTTTPEQLEAAARFMDAKRAAMPAGAKVWTELEPLKMYHPAEDYHQQYLARGGRFGNAQSPAKGCNDPIRCYG